MRILLKILLTLVILFVTPMIIAVMRGLALFYIIPLVIGAGVGLVIFIWKTKLLKAKK